MLTDSPIVREMSVRLTLFGSPAIDLDGESSALPFERRNQLLVFLALKRSWVGRADLAALLWPEQEQKLAYANLRKALFRLQSLPWADRIESNGRALRFDVETDVFAFDSALRERRIADALSLRRGELLAGFEGGESEAWSSWLAFERDRVRLAWRDAALDRLEGDVDPTEGIELSARLLDADPLDEAALRARMSWLTRSGQPARARQVYREFVARLESELGIAPGSEVRALHEALGATRSATAATASAAPMPDDGFVGRAVELRRIAELLGQDDCRLLCLIGPGGVGKTRLAARASDEMAARYADGVAWVPLEDVASSSELGPRIARSLGIGLAGSKEPLEQVVAFLRERQMLLALDNFEQLAADAPILERLLEGCPRLKLVVTSRMRLAVPSERLLPIDGLPYPEAGDQDRIEAFDAVRLFIRAAHRVEPGLVPAVEAASILDICRQVEGLPLALELAASWTRVLSCEAIAAELRQGTELLHTADAAQPTRHASIEVVFEQSWRLLSAIERDALARLSVFRGGFSAAAARSIAGASLPVLAALADKSLTRKSDARIFLHPLVQQLAGLRLQGEARESTERAHALYFHRLLAQLHRAVEDGDREALQAVETEFENCRAAWRWSIAHDEMRTIRASAETVLHFCDHRARFDECFTLMRDAEARAAIVDPGLRVMLLATVSHLEYRLDRYADAMADATRALNVSRGKPDRDARLQCLKTLGACSYRLGKLDDANRYYRRALELAPAGVDPHNAAAMLGNLALVEKAMGHYGEAARLSVQSLVEHRRLGDVADEALCLNNLGDLYLIQGAYDSAEAYLKESLAICERHGLASTRGASLSNLAEIAIKTGEDAAAESYARRALEFAESTGNRSVICWLKLLFVRLAARRRDLHTARTELAAALEMAMTLGRPTHKLSGVCCFAELLEAQGQHEGARLILAFVADHPLAIEGLRAEARTRLSELGPPSGSATWPGIEPDELIRRIIAETSIAHAPLIATLAA
jgi:predicted ATPase/DNA-binding SARP family transcriptional activator/Tfp pilus assembly protein PilF